MTDRMTDRTLDMIRRFQANAVELRREAARKRRDVKRLEREAAQCEHWADQNDKRAIELRSEGN